jgi:predicted nucleic acid-binding protein
VAAAVRNDPDHRACAELLQREAGSLIVPALVLAEAGYLVRKALDSTAEAALLRAAARAEFRLEAPTSGDLDRMAELVETYADLPLGTVDASVVALAERLGLESVATLDRRHFSIVRPGNLEAFILLPA